jgi:hypothetical protein
MTTSRPRSAIYPRRRATGASARAGSIPPGSPRSDGCVGDAVRVVTQRVSLVRRARDPMGRCGLLVGIDDDPAAQIAEVVNAHPGSSCSSSPTSCAVGRPTVSCAVAPLR